MALLMALAGTSNVFAGSVSWALPNNTQYGPISGLSGTSLVNSKAYGSSTYTRTSTVNAGDKVAVMVYFHNDGNAPSTNTKIKLDQPSGSRSSFTLHGSVNGGGTDISGSTVINISGGSRTLTYIPGSLRVGYDRATTGTSVSNDTAIFSGSGLDIGTIQGMDTCGTGTLCHQGWVAIGFQVSQDAAVIRGCTDSTANNYNPNATQNDGSCTYTQNSQLDVDTGGTNCSNYTNGICPAGTPVTLNGTYTSARTPVQTCFVYRKVGSSAQTVVDSGDYNVTVKNFAYTVSGLSNGTYEYTACADNGSGTESGSPRQFTVGNTVIINDNVQVSTRSARNITTYSADLVGSLDDIGSGSVERWFEYSTSQSTVINGYATRTSLSNITNSTGEFTRTVSGLSQDTNYYFRACGRDSSGNTDCGEVYNFRTSGSNYCDTNNCNTNDQTPTVQTLPPFAPTDNFVTLDGYFNVNSCSGNTYFEYGTSAGFGNRTTNIYRAAYATGSMAQSINGLSPSTVYYYRAVVQNCQSTVYGLTRSFQTTNRTIISNPPVVIQGTNTIVRNTVTTIGGGAGSQYIRLTIDNSRDTITRNDELVYEVTWDNISKSDLKDLVLEVSFPESLQIVTTERGQIDRKANIVYVNIPTLKALEKDSMIIRARVIGTLRDNDPITARAIMAFENPLNRAQENAIAYDSDTYFASQNVLGASIFGLDFLPGTLAGWLFLILLIILLILVIRYATARREDRNDRGGMHGGMGGPTPTPAPAPIAHTEYSQTEYTPYRPTPRN